MDLKAAGDNSGCSQFHFMPRFVRELPDNGKEILSMNQVLQYLMVSSAPLIHKSDLKGMVTMNQFNWQNCADEIKVISVITQYPLVYTRLRSDTLCAHVYATFTHLADIHTFTLQFVSCIHKSYTIFFGLHTTYTHLHGLHIIYICYILHTIFINIHSFTYNVFICRA